MATAELEFRVGVQNKDATVSDLRFCESDENIFHCLVALIREEDGSFSGLVLNLPGAGSSGKTEEDAIRNVKESVCGLIESYKATGDPIPWKDATPGDIPAGANRPTWILVHV